MQEAGDAIKNKIGQFTANPVIRNIVGQPHSSFDIRKMMDEKKIIIMNLSKGLIGETNANLLGSMLTTRIYLAAMSRADLSLEKMRTMPNFYFYVDEFQSFANATFANILSEARKYHLNLTIAHQYIEQMEEDVRNAVFGNVGTIISFRVGPFDAEVLETIFSPEFLAADIVNLGFAQIYLTLMIDGIGSKPFSATTLPPIEPPTISCRDMVIAASRVQFARDRTVVEAEIQKFHEPIVPVRPPREGVREGGERRDGARVEAHGSQPTHPERRSQPTTEGWDGVDRRRGSAERRAFVGAEHERRKEDRRAPRERRAMPERQNTAAEVPRETKSRQPTTEELRSVLRRIVDAEKPREEILKQEMPKQTADKQVEPRPAGEPRTDLKNALTVALEKPKEIPKHEPAQGAEPAPRPSEASITPPPQVKPVPRDPGLEEPPISPKELERMMRVTTSDKSPF
jgi:hypothetical protein